MATTTFTDQSTTILAAWLNDVNSWTYTGVSKATQIQVLGGGTVALPAYSFTTATSTGWFVTGGSLAATVLGKEHLTLGSSASAVNWLHINAANTGNGPGITAAGAETNVLLALSSKGTGNIDFWTSNFTDRQLRISATASSANFFNLTGNTTGNGPALLAAGTDTNIPIQYVTKGTGGHDFYTNNAGPAVQQFKISHTASAVNYISVTGAVTSGLPRISATGSDTDVGLALSSKGASFVSFYTNNFAQEQLRVTHIASAVNFVNAQGSATGNPSSIGALGNDSDIGFDIFSKGTGNIRFRTNTSGVTQALITHTANAVNQIQFTGSALGSSVAIFTGGTDTNIGINYTTKGTGIHSFSSDNNTATIQFQIGRTASSVNYWQVIGNATLNAPGMSLQGSDTNISGSISSKGTGQINIQTGGYARTVAQFLDVASSVNFWTVSGAATAADPVLAAAGSDTNISARITSKGTGAVRILTGTNARIVAEFADVASSVNYWSIIPSATGSGVAMNVAAASSDTNVAINVNSKGTGNINLNPGGGSGLNIQQTASANRAVTVTGSNGANPTISTSAGNLAITPSVEFAGSVMVQNSQSAPYTLVAADANKHILHPTADNNARTFTIPANASVAYATGTMLTFVNQINTVTIAITSDTMTLAGTGTTGSRTLAAAGIATAVKISSTEWIISGTGLT